MDHTIFTTFSSSDRLTGIEERDTRLPMPAKLLYQYYFYWYGNRAGRRPTKVGLWRAGLSLILRFWSRSLTSLDYCRSNSEKLNGWKAFDRPFSFD